MAVGDYEPIIHAASQEWNVDPIWLKSLMQQETGGNRYDKFGRPITSSAGAGGLMQIMPETARGLGVKDVHDPVEAIFGAAKLGNELLDKYKNVTHATMAYNARPSTVDAYLEGRGPLPIETQKYVPAVASHYRMFAAKSGAPASKVENVADTKKKADGQESIDAFLKRTGADVSPAEDIDAFLKRTGAATSPEEKAPPAPTEQTPNDASGTGRDEYGQPINPLASPEPPGKTLTGGDLGRMTRDQIVSAARSTQTPKNGEPPAGMGGAGEVDNAAAGMGGAPVDGTLSPIGRAAAQGFGSEPLGMNNKLVAAMRDAGVYPPENGNGTPMQRINEGVMTPVGMAVDAGLRGASALFRGAQEGVAQAGAAAGAPRLGREIAALPEAFGGSPGMLSVPRAPGAVPVNRLASWEPAYQRPLPEGVNPMSSEGARTAVNKLAPVPEGMAMPNPQEAARVPAPPMAPEINPPSGARSVGASASSSADAALTQRQELAYRATAEMNKLTEPQPVGRDPTAYIEGVNPSRAHIEQSANVSREAKMLESAIPEEAKTIAKENNEARQVHFQRLAGSDVDIANAIAERGARAETDLAETWKNKTEANPQPVIDAVTAIKASPDGRRPVVRNAVDSVVAEITGRDGKLVTDPEQLYGVRKHIDDLLSKEAGRDDPKSIRAAANLMEVKRVLDQVIEGAAPGFRQYLDNFADASRPIDTMKTLQSYEPKLVDTQGRMQLSRVQRMMNDIVTSRKSSDPIAPHKSIPDDVMAQLWALRDDLRRVASADELARARGSDTAQNFMDIAKNVGGVGADLAGHAAATAAMGPGLGSLTYMGVKAALMNRLAARNSARMNARAHNMLNVPRTELRPLNPPE